MDPETLAEILADVKISLYRIESMLAVVLKTITNAEDTEETPEKQEENVEL